MGHMEEYFRVHMKRSDKKNTNVDYNQTFDDSYDVNWNETKWQEQENTSQHCMIMIDNTAYDKNNIPVDVNPKYNMNKNE